MNMLKDERSKNELTSMLLNILKDLRVQPDIIEKAERFFDKENDIDVSLLDFPKQNNLYYQNVSYSKWSSIKRKVYSSNNISLIDKFILFFDALSSSSLSYFFEYNLYIEINKSQKLQDDFIHAFEHRYDSELALAKLKSYSIGLDTRYFEELTKQNMEFARQNPRVLFESGKFCIENDLAGSAVKAFAYALGFAEDGVFTDAEKSYMIDYILKDSVNVKRTNFNNSYEFSVEMSMLFMAAPQSVKISKMIVLKGKDKVDMLIEAISEFFPADYFEKNTERLVQLLEEIEPDVCEIIKACLLCNHKSGTSVKEINSAHLLSYYALHKTEEYIKVMFMTDKINNYGAMGYVPAFYSCFFDTMYKILKETVPDAEEKYGLDHDRDMIEAYIRTEEQDANKCSDEIGKYLRGEEDISVLINNRDKLGGNNRSEYHTIAVIDTLDNLVEFRAKYISFKVIQSDSYICNVFAHYLRSDEKKLRDYVKDIIKEGVPYDIRFAVYSKIYESYYLDESEKKLLDKTLSGVMSENRQELDETYRNLVSFSGLLARKLYAMYLSGDDGTNKEQLLKLCGDTSKAVRSAAANSAINNKAIYENDIKEMLKAKKQAMRETAVDILTAWGAADYYEILDKAADAEKSIKLADKIRSALSSSSNSDNNREERGFDIIRFVEDIHKGGRAKKLLWLYETEMPKVRFIDGALADDKYMQAILLCYSGQTEPKRNENAENLIQSLDKKDLESYVNTVYSRWYDKGADTKTKWAMYFSVINGGSEMLTEIKQCIKDWAQNMRGAIAAESVKAMAANGSGEYLMAVDEMAHKFKQKQVKKAAAQAIENAADVLGITAEELGDRIIPDLGFDENMQRIFDYGSRKFKVYISYEKGMEVYDDTDKKLKNLPSPGKKDDEEKAKAAYEEYKAIKKQLKSVLSIQNMRLENALITGRKWKKNDWEKLFVHNPIMHSFATGLIWSANSDQNITTFRYMEDGSYNTKDEDEFELPENCIISLVHPIDMDKETIEQWKEQLEDYEINQPFVQLSRNVNVIKEDEKGKIDLMRFSGREVNGMTLLGRTAKLGWQKGSVQDAGCFYTFYREDITGRITKEDGTVGTVGFAVELNFEGMYVGGDDSDMEIKNVRFYYPGAVEYGSYMYDSVTDEKAIPLDKVDARYFSEIVNQLEEITKSANN